MRQACKFKDRSITAFLHCNASLIVSSVCLTVLQGRLSRIVAHLPQGVLPLPLTCSPLQLAARRSYATHIVPAMLHSFLVQSRRYAEMRIGWKR